MNSDRSRAYRRRDTVYSNHFFHSKDAIKSDFGITDATLTILCFSDEFYLFMLFIRHKAIMQYWMFDPQRIWFGTIPLCYWKTWKSLEVLNRPMKFRNEICPKDQRICLKISKSQASIKEFCCVELIVSQTESPNFKNFQGEHASRSPS